MTTALLTAPYGHGRGLVITPAGPGSIADIDRDHLLKLLAESGFLLLRGFGADMESFTALVKNTSVSTTIDPARDFYSEVAQKVDAGTGPIGLHTENGNNPFRSHLAWFFSEKAAREGSQTTVCDGHRVWEALSDEARAAFSAQDIVYSRYVGEKQWRAMAFHMLQQRVPQEEITFDHLLSLAAAAPGTEVALQQDGGITYAFRTPAAASTLFGDRIAFANSILGPSTNYEKPRITFADGTEFAPALLAEVEEVTERLTENLEWQDGDVALIDNTRVMHGRREIVDTARTIYNALSYIEVEAA
ncbi:TauD/TfdA family dioxygenase [Kitasatospora sp. NPDC057541]|uniref:TauD/TfdA family dioxygenase n=1 Tax=unclassified Kitasatospora TaxID=2633591 RepID=UPI00369B3583